MIIRHRMKKPFQSTLPVRGATSSQLSVMADQIISIHAPREGSDAFPITLYSFLKISIHAPREGSDQTNYAQGNPDSAFQSTLPGRGATAARGKGGAGAAFQSTLPGRGATRGRDAYLCHGGYFNPRSPGGERLLLSVRFEGARYFNPRSP